MSKNVRSSFLSHRVLNWHAAIKLLRASAKVAGALSSRGILTGSAAVVAFAITASPVLADNYYWDGGTTDIATNGDGVSQGGAGTWSTAIANWDVGSGVPHSVWVDGNTANFGGTGATVTLGTAITTDNIFLGGSSGYTLATNGNQLTLTGGLTTSTNYLNTINGTGSLALTGGGTHTFSLSGAALNISAAITGSDNITLTAGNLGLSGSNTGFTGKVTANGGRLFINSDLSLGAVPATFVADSLTLNGATYISGVVTGTGANYNNATPTLSANRGITLGANGGVFQIGYGSNGLTTINGAISGTGALTKSDNGKLVLNGTNTYGGVTNVYNVGTLVLNGSNSTSGALIYDDCTLQLGSGGTTGSLAANSTISITNGGSSNSNLTINRSNAVTQGTDFATISGNGSVRLIGAGTTTLNAANTYSGGTTVSAGVLSVSTIADSGTSNIGPSTGNNNTITLNGGTLQYTGSVAATTGRPVKTNTSSTLEVTDASGSLNLTGSTQGNGSGIFTTKTGAGTLILSGTQDNQNLRVTLNAGTLVLNKTGTGPHAVGTQGGSDYALVINGGTAQVGNTAGDQIYSNSSVNMTGGTFDLNGAGEGFDGLFGTAGTITNTASTTTSTLTLGQNNSAANGAGTPRFGGVFVDGAGVLALTKTGTGTQVLTGASTYTGATTVSAGTLSLDNNNSTTPRLANTSGITVNGGGTLLLAQSGATASTDRIGNAVPVTLSASATANGGGKFSTGGLSEGPANGVSGQSAAMGALTLGNNSTIDFTTGATAAGSNLLFASLSYTSGDVVSIRNFTGAAGADNGAAGNDRLLIIGNPSLSDAQLASITFYNDAGTAFATGATEISFNGYTELVPVPVPEPATWAAGALLVASVGVVRRRKLVAWLN